MATIRRIQPIVLLPGALVLSVDEVNRVIREVNEALDAIRVELDARPVPS